VCFWCYKYCILNFILKMKKIRFVNSKDFSAEKHGFHLLIKSSSWPFLTLVGLLDIALYTVLIFDNREVSYLLYLFLWLYFFMVIGMWFRDVIIESHQGMLYIKSSTWFQIWHDCFFNFWNYVFLDFSDVFYKSNFPSIWIGSHWLSLGIQPINLLHLLLLKYYFINIFWS